MTSRIFILIGLVLSLARPVPAQNCSNSSTGLIPINDLGPGFYRGFQGGLYPDGENDIPIDHLSAGLEFPIDPAA